MAHSMWMLTTASTLKENSFKVVEEAHRYGLIMMTRGNLLVFVKDKEVVIHAKHGPLEMHETVITLKGEQPNFTILGWCNHLEDAVFE